MSIKRTLVLFATVGVLVGVGAGCGGGGTTTGTSGGEAGGKASGGDLTKVNVGFLPSIDNAFFWRAQDAGYYRDEGLDVTLTPTAGGPAVIAGIVGGSFAIGQSDVVSLLTARSKGIDVKAVLFYRFDTPKSPDLYLMAKDPQIKGPRDVVGKALGVNVLNSISQLAAQEWLRKAGLKATDVKYMEVGFPEVNSVLSSGRVPIATSLDPFKAMGEAQGQHVVATDVDALRQHPGQPIVIAGLLTTSKNLEEKPDVIKGIVEGSRRALNDLADPKVLRATLIRHLHMSKAVAQQVTPIDYDNPAYSQPPSGQMLEPWKQAAVRYGWLPSDLNLSDAIGKVK